jgi:protein TonB
VLPEPQVTTGLVESIGALVSGEPGHLVSPGPGTGPGEGGERGKGIGTEPGDRLGSGGEGSQPGNGVSWPRLVREVKPNYTADAMRAQVEGMVELEIVVLPDGSVGRVSVVRSLDSRFGLDQEAIRAVRSWRFEPGRRLGKAVPVRVGVELSFNLR